MTQGFMERRKDPKWVANMTGTSGIAGAVLWMLAFIFALLGIIADATDGLGLSATSWLLLAIVFHLAWLSYWISWALGVYFISKKEA